MQYFYSSQFLGNQIELSPEESTHATKVLRKHIGDELFVLDGLGSCFRTVIMEASKVLTLNILDVYRNEERPTISLHMAISPTKKADKMEWMVEKLTEIGVQKLSFVQTEKGERSRINNQRLLKKAISAMKQSGNLWLPEIQSDISFKTFIKSEASKKKYIAHCFEFEKANIENELADADSICVLIGPEGDFSANEVKHAGEAGFEPLSLGIPRYRTETAAIVACTLINHFYVTLKSN